MPTTTDSELGDVVLAPFSFTCLGLSEHGPAWRLYTLLQTLHALRIVGA